MTEEKHEGEGTTHTSTHKISTKCENCGMDEDNRPKFFLGCCLKLDQQAITDLHTLCEHNVLISWNSTCSGRTTLCVDGCIPALKDLLSQPWAKNCFHIG